MEKLIDEVPWLGAPNGCHLEATYFASTVVVRLPVVVVSLTLKELGDHAFAAFHHGGSTYARCTALGLHLLDNQRLELRSLEAMRRAYFQLWKEQVRTGAAKAWEKRYQEARAPERELIYQFFAHFEQARVRSRIYRFRGRGSERHVLCYILSKQVAVYNPTVGSLLFGETIDRRSLSEYAYRHLGFESESIDALTP